MDFMKHSRMTARRQISDRAAVFPSSEASFGSCARGILSILRLNWAAVGTLSPPEHLSTTIMVV